MEISAANFKGRKGTYVSVIPTGDSIAEIRKFLPNIPEASEPASFHATVIYSKSILTKDGQDALLKEVDTVFNATAVAVTTWVGHDDNSYVVLELESPELAELNKKLKTEYGLVTNFDDYRCHVTLAADLTPIPPKSVRIKPVKLQFFGLRIEDAK
jgi:hypothetical protein